MLPAFKSYHKFLLNSARRSGYQSCMSNKAARRVDPSNMSSIVRANYHTKYWWAVEGLRKRLLQQQGLECHWYSWLFYSSKFRNDTIFYAIILLWPFRNSVERASLPLRGRLIVTVQSTPFRQYYSRENIASLRTTPCNAGFGGMVQTGLA